jgi:hypothetical protein
VGEQAPEAFEPLYGFTIHRCSHARLSHDPRQAPTSTPLAEPSCLPELESGDRVRFPSAAWVA